MKPIKIYLIISCLVLNWDANSQDRHTSGSNYFIYSGKDYFIDTEKQIIIRRNSGRELPEPFNITPNQLRKIDSLLQEINFTNHPADITVKNPEKYKKLLVVSAECDDEIQFSYKKGKKKKKIKWNDCSYKPEHEAYITNLRKLHQIILKMAVSTSKEN